MEPHSVSSQPSHQSTETGCSPISGLASQDAQRRCRRWADAVEKVANCSAANLLPKRRNTRRLLVEMPTDQLPKSLASLSLCDASPTQLYDSRTYGSENLRSAMQKDFFDSIGQQQTSLTRAIQSPRPLEGRSPPFGPATAASTAQIEWRRLRRMTCELRFVWQYGSQSVRSRLHSLRVAPHGSKIPRCREKMSIAAQI